MPSLFEIVESQGGYFTAQQAVSAGISNNNHSYHVKKGNWIREWRGVYRLKNYPFQEDGQYALWGVWSINRKGDMQGVYSHETALSMYDLSDSNPSKLHLTLPRGFRRHSEIPSVLKLHFSQMSPSEYEDRGGYKVTKPFRTIADVLRGGSLSNEFIFQAVTQGLKTGALTQAQYANLKTQSRVGTLLCKIMGEKV